MFRSVDGLDRAADVKVLDRRVQVGDGGVGLVVGAKDLLGLVGLVRLVDRRDWGRALLSDILRAGNAAQASTHR